MTRQILYVAHPLAPTEDEIASRLPGSNDVARRDATKWALQDNLQRALRWLAWLRKSFPETTFIAPWIAAVMSGEDDADPAAREAGLVDDCAVVERCDGIVLCGGRISSGMRREMEHSWGKPEEGGPFQQVVHDLTPGGVEPPGFPPGERPNAKTFADYMAAVAVVVRARSRE